MATKLGPARDISKEQKERLLAIKKESITIETFEKLFANTISKKDDKIQVIPPEFNPYDRLTLEKGEYINKEKVETTCGIFMFNKYVLEGEVEENMGYVNYELSKKGLGVFNESMATLLLDDKITPQQFANVLNRMSHLAFSFNTQISSSMTLDSLKPIPDVDKRKSELLAKHAEEIERVDLVTITNIENELVQLAKEKKKDDVDMELYTSGARGAFENSYKNAMIMKGPVYNTAKGEWECMTNSFSQGAQKSDIPVLANSVVSGAYPKAIGTAECGYKSKQLSAGFQSVKLGPKGSDCGSKKTESVLITNENKALYTYRYIVEGGKLVCLSGDVIGRYVGKTVNMRSLLYCTSDDICNKCGGDLMYKIGITNIGLTTPRISNSMLNAKMKAFHDSTIKTVTLNADEIFL